MYSENSGASSDPSLSILKKAGVVCRLEIAGNARPCRVSQAQDATHVQSRTQSAATERTLCMQVMGGSADK